MQARDPFIGTADKKRRDAVERMQFQVVICSDVVDAATQMAVVADVDLAPGWNPVSFDVARPPTGSNELVIDSALGPALDGPLPRPALGLAGVAIGVVDVAFLPAR